MSDEFNEGDDQLGRYPERRRQTEPDVLKMLISARSNEEIDKMSHHGERVRANIIEDDSRQSWQ